MMSLEVNTKLNEHKDQVTDRMLFIFRITMRINTEYVVSKKGISSKTID